MQSVMQYNSGKLLEIGKLARRNVKLSDYGLVTILKNLGILRYRGTRGGRRRRVKSKIYSNQGVHLQYLRYIPQSIETINSSRNYTIKRIPSQMCTFNLVKFFFLVLVYSHTDT